MAGPRSQSLKMFRETWEEDFGEGETVAQLNILPTLIVNIGHV